MFERLANVDSFIYSDSNGEITSIYDPAKLQICVEVDQRDVAASRRTAGGSHPRFGKKLHLNGGVIDEVTFGQIPICSKNRRDQFIPAPSKLRFNRLQIAIFFGAKAFKFKSVSGSRLANSTKPTLFCRVAGENVYSRRDLLHQLEIAEADRRSAVGIEDHALVMADR